MSDLKVNQNYTNESKGINEEKLDALVVEVYDYASRIKHLLNEVDDLVESTKEYYNCEEADEFRNKFDSLKSNFPTINKNIISYAEDLVNAKLSYLEIDDALSSFAKEEAKKVLDSGIQKYQEKR